MSILSYTFFQNALLGSLLASILCGLIGTYIVARRLVFISGGITHASFSRGYAMILEAIEKVSRGEIPDNIVG